MAATKPKFNYGGQAVMEGVMMRGVHIAAIAVRDPKGNIVIHEERLNPTLYRGWVSKIPFARGLVGLWDALGLGTRALVWSANVALSELAEEQGKPDEEMISGVAATGLVVVSLSLGIGLFFVLPTAATSGAKEVFGIKNTLALESIEGVIKLSILIGYIAAIGMMKDVKRLFGYHGAEHKAINAYEGGHALTIENVQKQPIEHPRCGTAFLLTVVVLSIFIGGLVGRPHNLLALLASRVLLIPVIAGVAYEILRYTARNADKPWVKLMIAPNLWLQRLTTRQPDDSMVEVAIAALNRVLETEHLTATAEARAEPEAVSSVPYAATASNGRSAV
jgi:uncharacterized protein YqhQ